jgi:hypothetical protein
MKNSFPHDISTKMLDFFKISMPAAIICHDAGSANIIIAGLKRIPSGIWRVYVGGPAEAIWNAAFPGHPIMSSFEEAIDGARCVITGTSWASDLEHQARKYARTRNIYCYAVIDHWVNYLERFVFNDEVVYPDEIWVTDYDAFNIAKIKFPKNIIVLYKNWYIEDQISKISKIHLPLVHELLYVMEPARDTWGKKTAGEFQALNYFFENTKTLKLPSDIVFIIRPHPSDPIGKYDEWISRMNSGGRRIEIDHNLEIFQSLGRATWVVGCETFALVLALKAGKIVYCSLPPWAPQCSLPQTGLLHLAKMVN